MKDIFIDDIKNRGDKIKSSLLSSLYVLLPSGYWEDKNEKCSYIVMERMTKSVLEII